MKKKSNINYLELTPERVHEHIIEENKLVTVLVPRFSSRFWKKILAGRVKNKFINLNLDELGSATWLQIDGNKNVAQICESLINHFGEDFVQAEERITKFMSQLYLNKMIKFKELKK